MMERQNYNKNLRTHDDFISLYIKAACDALKFSGPIEKDARAEKALWFSKTDDFTEVSNALKVMYTHAGYDAAFEAAKFISKLENNAEARLEIAIKLGSMAKNSPNMFQEIAGSLNELRIYEREGVSAFALYTDKFALFLLLHGSQYQYLTAGEDSELIRLIEKLKDKKMSDFTWQMLDRIEGNLRFDIFNRAERMLKTMEKLHRM